MARNPTQLTGAAGEHYVMYRLLRQGYIAALAPRGAEGIDILISDRTGAHLAAVQVKTASEPVSGKWQMTYKAERLCSPNLFYCFVSPGPRATDASRCWIVPSAIVAEHVRLSHQAWLAGTPLRGNQRKDGQRRSMHFRCEPFDKYDQGWMDQYEEAWELLGGTSST